jgi:hypothetical protein
MVKNKKKFLRNYFNIFLNKKYYSIKNIIGFFFCKISLVNIKI